MTDATSASARGTGRGARLLALCLVACLCLAADQALKAAMRDLLADGARRVLVPGVLDLVLVSNTGAAFSMGEGAGVALVAVALLVAVGALAWVARRPDMPWSVLVPLGCVVGGGLGNMVDRVAAGSVTDFLATSFVDFPVFNLADVFVTCGVVCCLVAFWRWDAAEGERP